MWFAQRGYTTLSWIISVDDFCAKKGSIEVEINKYPAGKWIVLLQYKNSKPAVAEFNTSMLEEKNHNLTRDYLLYIPLALLLLLLVAAVTSQLTKQGGLISAECLLASVELCVGWIWGLWWLHFLFNLKQCSGCRLAGLAPFLLLMCFALLLKGNGLQCDQ